MKQFRIFPLASCLVLALYFLIFSFPGISFAELTPEEKCINTCVDGKYACFNRSADRRICEVEFQNCVSACKEENKPASGNSKSSTDNKAANVDKTPM